MKGCFSALVVVYSCPKKSSVSCDGGLETSFDCLLEFCMVLAQKLVAVRCLLCFIVPHRCLRKDLMYFHKISAALGMQSVVAVSSVRHMLAALRIPGIRAISINTRNLATWSLDASRVDRILANPEGG